MVLHKKTKKIYLNKILAKMDRLFNVPDKMIEMWMVRFVDPIYGILERQQVCGSDQIWLCWNKNTEQPPHRWGGR